MPSIDNNFSISYRLRSYLPIRKMFKKNCLTITALCTIIAFITILIFFSPEPSTQITYPKSLSSVGSFRLYLQSQQISHRAHHASDKTIVELVNSIDMNEFQIVLKPILVERVVGTRSHENVKNYIINKFERLNWTIELDAFEDVTPHKGKMLFTNIVATHNPNAERYMALACHYDSKLSDFKFIGATDSAVPCAMLIYLAQILDKFLKNLKSKVALKLIFFDGEEAFVNWTETDSLYGSRHLADVWHLKEFHDSDASHLHSIDLLLLLDLVGAPAPKFYNLHEHSKRWFKLLVDIERHLGQLRLIETELTPAFKQHYYFHDIPYYEARIEDDHIPFLKKGVPILHLIPVPFPEVWHTAQDDVTAINLHTIKNLLSVIKIFVWQYVSGTSSN